MILIVDDIAANRYLLESVLRGAGYEVSSVTNGAEALVAARESLPELVISDILMPVMDGFELCRQWKEDETLQDVPFVFYTATYTEPKDEAFALSLGAERFLVKPLRTVELITVVREVLGAHQSGSVKQHVPRGSETEVLEQYREVLFHKLEKKVAQLEAEIAARLRSEEALRESEMRYRRLFESAKDGILILDHETGRILDSNPCIESLTGLSKEELHGRTVWEVGMFSDSSAFDVALADLQSNEYIRYDDVPLRVRSGSSVDVELVSSSYSVHGTKVIQCNVRDITERKRAEEQARFDAFHDHLTLLPNRALFMDRLGMAIARAKRSHDYLYAVLFVDIDRFKLVNDSLGHSLGDRLLVDIAMRFAPCLREADTLARWGGDEFAILLDGIHHPNDATRIAERIQHELRLPLSLEGHDVYATASIGMTLSSPAYERPEEVLRDADTAMYRAKARGRDRYSVFDESMHSQAVSLLKLESDMRRGLEREEFRLHYQPIVTLRERKVIGFEALVRWQHPENGLLAPNTFIPVAEDTGLIVPLGRWVLREACRQMRSWLQDADGMDAPFSISVNVASRQLADVRFVGEVDDVLAEFALPPERLKIEITESVLIEHVDVAIGVLAGLRERGVHVCMDDFGTGYSSLSNLLRYPVDVLKIDRTFVGRIGSGKDDSPIVSTILTLARNLGIGVVAEGVETESQRARLMELDCVHGQGYLFARPLEADAAWDFARGHGSAPAELKIEK